MDKLAYLVDGDPVLHPISQSLEQDLGVGHEIIDHFFTDESAILVLEGLGVIPVEDCHARGDPFFE